MSAEQSVTEKLGVDKDVLASKCATCTRFLLESKLFGGKTTDEFVEQVKNSFNQNELLFLAIGYITERTENIMNNDPEIVKIIDKAAIKHGVPEDVLTVVKAALGIKPEVNPN